MTKDIEALALKHGQGAVGEPVGCIDEIRHDGLYAGVYIYEGKKVNQGNPIYTSPPNTQAKLDKAIEALHKLCEIVECRGGELYDPLVNGIVKETLKELG